MRQRHCVNLFYIFILIFYNSCLRFKDTPESIKAKDIGEQTHISTLSFNILSTVDASAITKGYQSWDIRKKNVFAHIESKDTDLIAIQETSPSQLSEFKKRFRKKYHIFDNEAYSSDVSILVKKQKFDVLEKGHYILEKPTNLTRMRRLAVWAKLKDKLTQKELMVVSVHIDNNKWKKEQIKKLLQKLSYNTQTQAPVFILGDFNSDTKSDNYNFIIKNGFKDSYIKKSKEQLGTYPAKKPQKRIDHIFYHSIRVKTISYEIDNSSPPLSDHCSIFAKFIIEKSP